MPSTPAAGAPAPSVSFVRPHDATAEPPMKLKSESRTVALRLYLRARDRTRAFSR